MKRCNDWNRFGLVRWAGLCVAAASLGVSGRVEAQQPSAHLQFTGRAPPAAVGQERLRRGGPVVGFFQPVEISLPKDVGISMAVQGEWTDASSGPIYAGMLIGVPYRVKISNLPDYFRSRECYPTIEIIDRTYAPAGFERRFPIPIVFNENDLEKATSGMMVTRVVYIEDPGQALPGAQEPGDQLWFDAGVGADALEVADRLGRPVAIVRLGGRLPNEANGPDLNFLYGSPHWLHLAPPAAAGAIPTTAPQPARPIPTQPTPAPLTDESEAQTSAARRTTETR